MTVKIQRPRSVMDKFEDQVFASKFTVQLALNKNSVMGWQLNATDNSQPIVIDQVRMAGMVHDWNEANPDHRILVGDEISSFEGLEWSRNSHRLALNIQNSFKDMLD